MMLEVKDVSFEYHKPILKNVSFALEKGTLTALLGVNGAGKSTLLKCISGTQRPKSGEIFFGEDNIRSFRLQDLAKRIAYVAQSNVPTHCTVFDAVLIGRRPHLDHRASEEDYEIVENLLHELHLTDYALSYIDRLSGGEYQKVVLARALAQEPKLLLLDEPTSNLDIKNQIEVLEILRRICKQKNLTVLVSIHDINLAARYADRFLMLKDGTIFQNGDQEILCSENIDAVYGISSKVLEVDNKKFIITI